MMVVDGRAVREHQMKVKRPWTLLKKILAVTRDSYNLTTVLEVLNCQTQETTVDGSKTIKTIEDVLQINMWILHMNRDVTTG